MPRYIYKCTECDEQSLIFHLSDETATECPKCNTHDALVKELTSFTTMPAHINKQKVGEVTEEFIDDARQELKQQKQEMDKNR